MRLVLPWKLRRFASTLMLVAALAFVAQGTMILVSQVAAANGLMPAPAIAVSGSLHYHDPLARHFHVHHSENTPGHVHEPADHDDDAATHAPLVVTLGAAAADIPTVNVCAPSAMPSEANPSPVEARLEGVQPDGLNRPPSTPDIV